MEATDKHKNEQELHCTPLFKKKTNKLSCYVMWDHRRPCLKKITWILVIFPSGEPNFIHDNCYGHRFPGNFTLTPTCSNFKVSSQSVQLQTSQVDKSFMYTYFLRMYFIYTIWARLIYSFLWIIRLYQGNCLIYKFRIFFLQMHTLWWGCYC